MFGLASEEDDDGNSTVNKKSDNTTENTIKDMFHGEEVPEEDQPTSYKVGDTVPKAYWNLDNEAKRKYRPAGCITEKNEAGIWIFVKKDK